MLTVVGGPEFGRELRCRFSAGGACQRVVIGCKRNWQITGATQRLRGTAWLSPLRSVVGASFQLISSASRPRMAICSTRASGSGKAALKLPRLRSASIPTANRDCFSHGAYWTSLYRCNGKCTGRWYCHTHKRDPILRELISPVLGKPKKEERSRRDESGFVCASDRSGSKPHRLLCGWGLAIVRRRSF